MSTASAAAESSRARPWSSDRVSDAGLGYAAVVAVTVLWGVGPLLVKAIDASPLTILAVRYWIAVPVMVVVAKLLGAPLTGSVMKASLAGGIACTLAQGFAFASFQDTSLANAVLIGAIAPVLIAVLAVPMFGERLSPPQVALMVGTLGAIAVFVISAGDTSGASFRGDLFAVASLLAQTAYLLCIKRARVADVPAAAYITGVFLVGAVTMTPMAFLWGTPVGALDRAEWAYIVAIALLVGCLGHGMLTWAQKHVNVGVASTIILGTTVVTAVGAWIFFDEALDAAQIVAGAVVLGAIGAILTIQVRSQDDELSLVSLGEAPFAE
jgi:drug/metabolite transporter (DMT)-like permease